VSENVSLLAAEKIETISHLEVHGDVRHPRIASRMAMRTLE